MNGFVLSVADIVADRDYAVGDVSNVRLPDGRALDEALRNDPAAPPAVLSHGKRLRRGTEILAYVEGRYGCSRSVVDESSLLSEVARLRSQVRSLSRIAARFDEKEAQLETMRHEVRAQIASTVETTLLLHAVVSDAAARLCGVYLLYGDERRLLYVGQSVNVYARLGQHQKKDFQSAAIIPCAEAALNDLEGFLIRLLEPPLNDVRCAPPSAMWNSMARIDGFREVYRHQQRRTKK